MNTLMRRILVLVLLGFVNSCAGIQEQPTSVEQATLVPEPAVSQPATRPGPSLTPHYQTSDTRNRADVLPLLKQADFFEHGASYEQAAALLERALQLLPGDAEIWHRLARVRFKQGRYGQSEQLAHKSNSLLRNNLALEQENQKILTEVRRLLTQNTTAQ